MYKLIKTFLDYDMGPELFHDGAVKLDIIEQELANEEAALRYIQNYEIRKIKCEFAYEGDVDFDTIEATYSYDGNQAYVDVRADLGKPLGNVYFGRYIYKIIKVK